MNLGVGIPVHPFFISVLDSYGIAPSQITPVAWCHMMGTFLIWFDLGFGDPSLDIWHHLYQIHPLEIINTSIILHDGKKREIF